MSNVCLWEVPNYIPRKIEEAYQDFCNDPNVHFSEKVHVTQWVAIRFNCTPVYFEHSRNVRGFEFKTPEELTAFLIEWIA